MSRALFRDKLQVFPFYLMDVAPIEALALPILTPALGFNAITAPEIQVETADVVEANWLYSTTVVKRAKVGPITISRAATYYDSDFYRWMQATLHGDVEYFQSRAYGIALALATGAPTGVAAVGALGGLFGFPRVGGVSFRRNLLLVQYFARSNDPVSRKGAGPDLTRAQVSDEMAIAGAVTAQVALEAAGGGSILGTASLVAQGATGTGLFSRMPAKAWMLYGCLPTRYKGSSDFDASSSDVSIAELEIAVDHIEEISLAA